MSTVRFTGEVLSDGTIQPPKGLQPPPGKAEVTVNTGEPIATRNSLRDFAGVIHSGDTHAADNNQIDADLNKSNGGSPPEA